MKSVGKKYWPSILEGRLKPIAAVISALGVIIGGGAAVANQAANSVEEQFQAHLAPIEEQLSHLQLESAREQLVILMNHYDGDRKAIMDAAEYYFVELNGDLYLTSMFRKFAAEHDWDVEYIFIAKQAKWGANATK